MNKTDNYLDKHRYAFCLEKLFLEKFRYSFQHKAQCKHSCLSLKQTYADQDSGYILRSFKRNLSTNPSLTPASINHILKSLQKQAGLNQIGELSGHSFRVGAALDLLDKNIPLEKIMLRGGWKSETSAMRYLQSWNDSNWLIIN